MEHDKVVIGLQYHCRISGQKVRVTVLGEDVLWGGKPAYRVRNERTQNVVVKAASLLKPIPVTTPEQDMDLLVKYADGIF